jgi:hypothetical protein
VNVLGWSGLSTCHPRPPERPISQSWNRRAPDPLRKSFTTIPQGMFI